MPSGQYDRRDEIDRDPEFAHVHLYERPEFRAYCKETVLPVITKKLIGYSLIRKKLRTRLRESWLEDALCWLEEHGHIWRQRGYADYFTTKVPEPVHIKQIKQSNPGAMKEFV